MEICWQRQRRIVTDIWPCLKSGGILIYSTCTYNTKENEENIRWIRDEFGAEVLPLEISTDWNITGNLLSGEDFPAYRFLPHRTKGEGFLFGSSPQTGRERWEYLGRAGEILGKKEENLKEKERKLRVFPKNSFRHCMSGFGSG